MAYKFEINTLYLTVTDTVSGDILLNEVRSDIKWGLDSEDCYLIYFKSALPNGQEQSLFKVGENSFDFADIVDSTGVAFASESVFRTFLNTYIGHISDGNMLPIDTVATFGSTNLIDSNAVAVASVGSILFLFTNFK